MLGIPDFWVASGYLLVILSTLLCLIFGISRWNIEDPPEPLDDDTKYAPFVDNPDESATVNPTAYADTASPDNSWAHGEVRRPSGRFVVHSDEAKQSRK